MNRNAGVRVYCLIGVLFPALVASIASGQPEGVIGYEAIGIVPLEGDTGTNFAALSDLGWIALESNNRGANQKPCVWVNGRLYELPTPIGFDNPRVISGGISPTSGIIVGQVEVIDELFITTPVAWVAGNGTFVLQRLTGWGDCTLNDVNDAGTIAGGCWLPPVATVWRSSVVAEQLGPNESTGAAINRSNEVAGKWSQLPCMWKSDGTLVVISSDENGRANDINDFGEVVGAFGPTWNGLWREGKVIALPRLGVCSYGPYAINNLGQVVGYESFDPQCRTNVDDRAILWPDEQTAIELNTLTIRGGPEGGPLKRAYDINNAGQIIVSGGTAEVPGPFLLTPYNFNLSDPVPGVASQVNAITVTGLEPGQIVRLAAGFNPGAQALPNSTCLGGLLLIQNLKGVLPPATADNSGTATFIINVPASLRGQTLRLQAFDKDNCQISHSVDWTFQ